jgi:hypothetical protein
VPKKRAGAPEKEIIWKKKPNQTGYWDNTCEEGYKWKKKREGSGFLYYSSVDFAMIVVRTKVRNANLLLLDRSPGRLFDLVPLDR